MAGCCRFQTSLVWLQMFLGLAITGLCAYLHLFVDVITLRDKPFWAGIPLLLAGLFGTSFIGGTKNDYGSSSTCRFVFKVAAVIMSVTSLCTCLTSLVFASLHIYKLFSYSHCRHVTNGCLCFDDMAQTEGGHFYTPLRDCHVLFCEIKIYICVMAGLCLLSSLTTLSFLVTVWKSVYGATAPPPATSFSPQYRNGMTEDA